jgi:hypothetical protein
MPRHAEVSHIVHVEIPAHTPRPPEVGPIFCAQSEVRVATQAGEQIADYVSLAPGLRHGEYRSVWGTPPGRHNLESVWPAVQTGSVVVPIFKGML